MTAEELYQKEFGNAESIPKESVIRLLKNFAKALKIEREQALRIHDRVGRSEERTSEQFSLSQLWKMAQKYNCDDFIKMAEEIRG